MSHDHGALSWTSWSTPSTKFSVWSMPDASVALTRQVRVLSVSVPDTVAFATGVTHATAGGVVSRKHVAVPRQNDVTVSFAPHESSATALKHRTPRFASALLANENS